MLLRITLFLALEGLVATAWAQPQPAPPSGAPPTAAQRAARIEQLIQKLSDEQFAVREAAGRELKTIGNAARTALMKAAGSTDLETATRAAKILADLPKQTHLVVDALGQPIPRAAVTLRAISRALPAVPGAEPAPQPDTPAPIPLVADDEGWIGIPESEEGVRLSAQVEHAEYGVARCEIPSDKDRLIVPLVRAGSEGRQRALSGQLKSADGRPIAGAVVVCDSVRTPGEGLIDPQYPRGEVLSDDPGRFAIYPPPSEQRKAERGDLIPTHSRYSLTITVPGDDSLMPLAGQYANTAAVQIVLPRATRMHRFRFEDVGGGWIEDPEQWSGVMVQFERMQDGERVLAGLNPAELARGRKLLPGKYVAQRFQGGQSMEFLPVVIADNSPEQLDFRLAPAVIYRGVVVSGVTGEPVAGAFVMAYSSTSRNNLALLTADDWKAFAECPAYPPEDHAVVKRLGEFYGVQGLVRTGQDGRFEIRRPSDRQYYGLIAFAQDQLPFLVRLGSLKPDAQQRVDAGQFHLFPAAKVLVRPVFEGQRLAVSPQWLPEKDGQPEWFPKFRTAFDGSDRTIEYVHWLALNESQPIFVPADVRLRLRFDSPYDDKWTPATFAQPLRLEPGGSKDLGDVTFAASLPVDVRVVDARGTPVEGFAVRRMYQGENAWCVAHNTDQQGLAHFHAHANSQGVFRVSDLPGEAAKAKNLSAEFKIGDQSPPNPVVITVTDEQVQLLRGAKSQLPVPPQR